MSVMVQIPTALRRFTGERAEVPVSGATVGEALADLVRRHPEIGPHLVAADGSLRAFVHVFKGDSNVRDLERSATPVAPGETLLIVPAIAGGAPDGGGRSGGRELDDLLAGRELPELEPAERRRYSRHLILPEVGPEGQRRLKAARVLVVGAGGLGSPLGLYLAAAGVGTLGLVDFDVVDESNLQRQVLHGASDVGRKKLDAARERLGEVNPHVEVVAHETRLTSDNALEILEPYDVVVDGTDNFPTRYLVNDACVLLGKPNVYGSIFRFEGQVGVFWGAHGPCYRCLFAEPPPPGLVPSCAEGGVLGVLPGMIGALQANEAIKLILGRGEPVVGRLVLFDAWKLSFRELRLAKNPECPVCSEHPTQTGLIDYEEFCGVGGGQAEEAGEESRCRAGRRGRVRGRDAVRDRRSPPRQVARRGPAPDAARRAQPARVRALPDRGLDPHPPAGAREPGRGARPAASWSSPTATPGCARPRRPRSCAAGTSGQSTWPAASKPGAG